MYKFPLADVSQVVFEKLVQVWWSILLLLTYFLTTILLAGYYIEEMLHSALLQVIIAVLLSTELCGTDVQQQGEDKCNG